MNIQWWRYCHSRGFNDRKLQFHWKCRLYLLLLFVQFILILRCILKLFDHDLVLKIQHWIYCMMLRALRIFACVVEILSWIWKNWVLSFRNFRSVRNILLNFASNRWNHAYLDLFYFWLFIFDKFCRIWYLLFW
jgi:hypothetical protein